MSLKLSLKILLFIILIPFLSISQSVTHEGDKICFDVITASEIFNDLNYCDSVMKQKNDSINYLVYEVNECNKVVDKKDIQLKNKNTGLWITGGLNFIASILIAFFAN